MLISRSIFFCVSVGTRLTAFHRAIRCIIQHSFPSHQPQHSRPIDPFAVMKLDIAECARGSQNKQPGPMINGCPHPGKKITRAERWFMPVVSSFLSYLLSYLLCRIFYPAFCRSFSSYFLSTDKNATNLGVGCDFKCIRGRRGCQEERKKRGKISWKSQKRKDRTTHFK